MNDANHSNWSSGRLDKSVVQKLSSLSGFGNFWHVVFEWIMIMVAIAAYVRIPIVGVVPLLILFIGTRQYALYSLLHEAIHFMLVPNKKANDLIARVLLAWPLFQSLEKVRKTHFAHHKHLQTPSDPEYGHLHYREFQFPITINEFIVVLLKDITGVNYLIYTLRSITATLKRICTGIEPARSHMMRLALGVLIVGLFSSFDTGVELLLLWVAPYATVYQLLNRLRLCVEHLNVKDRGFQTRTIVCSRFEQLIVAPYNLGYHSEHHLYPTVPFCRLPDLHRLLTAASSGKRNVLVTNGYLNALKDCFPEGSTRVGVKRFCDRGGGSAHRP